MSNITKLRDVADSLLADSQFDQAYVLYDEIYTQVWTAIGSVQAGLSRTSTGFLAHNISAEFDFKSRYTEPAANTTFLKWFNLDTDLTLQEFAFALYGRLQCVCYSKNLIDVLSTSSVLTDYLVLYSLIVNHNEERRVTPLLKICTAVMDDNNRLKKLRTNYLDSMVSKQILEAAEKVRQTEWMGVNALIVEYMTTTYQTSTTFYASLKRIAGNSSFRSKKKYSKYEKYERYERYEKYERFEHEKEETAAGEKEKKFDHLTATDHEKMKYYGAVLGLQGRITKAQIRKKYLELVAQYHPDKVQHLGSELRALGESKTKDLNLAYEWLKMRFKIE
ncbi:MAG TPA: J domain-containing protein [Bacteroidota bacterium]|nr:J domain-containing protein [Bacteroidota bacterium]